MAAVNLRNVGKKFGDVLAVNDLSMSINDGEFFFLLGPSGCGKSTALRMIAGFLSPDSGTVSIGGVDCSNVPAHQRDTTMVFRNYALWPHMTVAQNVAFGLKLKKLPAAEIASRTEEALSATQIASFSSRYPNELSGGQQQRVALARAIALKPGVILFDEPLSNLDTRLRQKLRHELRELHSKMKITMVYVTHDQEEALLLADRIAIMQNGQIEQLGPPREIYDQPETDFVANFIGDSNLIPGKVVSNNDELIVETALGQFSVSANAPFALNQKVNLAIRPERVKIVTETGGPNKVTAVLRDLAFIGSGERLAWSCECKSAAAISITTSHSPASGSYKIGYFAVLEFPSDSLRVIGR